MVTADDVSDAVESVEGDGEGGDNPEPEGLPEEPEANGDGGQEPQAEGDKGSNLPPKLEGKSEEELAEMYLNLEDKLGEQGQEIAELRGRLEERGEPEEGEEAEPEPESPADKSAEEVAEQLADKYDLPDDVLDMDPKQLIGIVTKASAEVSEQQASKVVEDEVEPVKEEQARDQANKVVQSVQEKHDDFAQHKDEVLQKVQEPQYQAALQSAESMDQQVSVLEDIYKIVSSGEQSQNTQGDASGEKQNGRQTPDSSNARQTTGRGASTNGAGGQEQDEFEEKVSNRVRESMGLD